MMPCVERTQFEFSIVWKVSFLLVYFAAQLHSIFTFFSWGKNILLWTVYNEFDEILNFVENYFYSTFYSISTQYKLNYYFS